MLEPLLRDVGLSTEFAGALDDETFDEMIRAETEEALALTGRDVGTPILAAAGGIVIVSEPHPAYGQMIEIDHGNALVTR